MRVYAHYARLCALAHNCSSSAVGCAVFANRSNFYELGIVSFGIAVYAFDFNSQMLDFCRCVYVVCIFGNFAQVPLLDCKSQQLVVDISQFSEVFNCKFLYPLL